MANIYGRQVVVPMTNKSGASVAAGDVVIVDTTNNESFTTTTTSADPKVCGIAQETIASNAVGRILTEGYAALVNVNASVTRGNFGATHTVAKQATDAGASRVAGTFCRFLTGGTTPSAMVYPVDLAGAALTDPTTTRGDLITRGASVLARLAIGLAGKVLRSDGTDPSWQYPPGYEFDYSQITSQVSITHTTEGTADTCITGNSVSYDGATTVLIEVFSPEIITDLGAAGRNVIILLYEDSTLLGRIGVYITPAAAAMRAPLYAALRRTPSNASHTYTVKATTSGGTGTFGAGTGGTGADLAAFLRVTKV